MNPTPEQILDIEDALVTDGNPPRFVNDVTLDYERCARLHNYLVAYNWMARHKKYTPDMDALAREKWFWAESDERIQATRERLIPSLNSFLDLIYDPKPEFFYWVGGLIMSFEDGILPYEANELEDRFVVIYDTHIDLGPHRLGVVYDQHLCRASFPMSLFHWDNIDPDEEGHDDLWCPLETILSHWIYMVRLGRAVAGLPDDCPTNRSQLGLWAWLPYCDAQIHSTVAALERYSAAVESRMPPGSHLSLTNSTPLFFTDTELDAASVPHDCFIRSFLTRVKAPRFKFIAPGLEVPHDKEAFAADQKFTNMPYEDGSIPSVLLFASSHAVNLDTDTRWVFHQGYNMKDGDSVPAGLYSEPVRRSDNCVEEAGFRLLLPFALRLNDRHDQGARGSDGTLVRQGSFTDLFQHGNFHLFGGEWRAQRLERLFERWTDLVETGVWTVGEHGVEGSIDKFRDADKGNDAWKDYWIAPSW
ncbi:hypothetical protein N7454_004054 [Penicillium verhagenii]|nr:hypothetical protein N7454_004054 [Penicillium verhagenii]